MGFPGGLSQKQKKLTLLLNQIFLHPRQPWESLVSEGKFDDLKTKLRPGDVMEVIGVGYRELSLKPILGGS